MAGACAIGVDLGGTHVRAARISATGQILAASKQPTASEPAAVARQIVDLVRGLDEPDVAAIGAGIPGRVDAGRGRVLSGGFVDLGGLPLADLLAEALRRPVFLDNDGNMALVGEQAAGSARGAGTAVMFTIGTGIGGAVLSAGKVFRGRRAAGQLGHLTVESGGRKCLCGRRGCVETTSSGTALARHMAEAGVAAGTGVEALLALAAEADASARKVLAAWAGPMRIAIDTAVAAFDPDIVVLGGGLGGAMHRALAAFPGESAWYQCPVVPAALGDRAGVIGAGLSALAHQAERDLA